MDRPVPPEPSERPKIKKAYRVAKFMKGLVIIPIFLSALIAFVAGSYSSALVGLILFLMLLTIILFTGCSAARCPRCGQIWGIGLGLVGFGGQVVDETETFVCRRCRLDIGLGLRD